MAAKNPRGRASAEASNPDIPVATPSFSGMDNWSMKALVDLNGSVARLESAINNLAEKVDEVRGDQQKQLERIDKVERKILVASAIISVLLILGSAVLTAAGYVGNKAIEFGLKMAEQRMTAPVAQPAPTLQPAPTPTKP